MEPAHTPDNMHYLWALYIAWSQEAARAHCFVIQYTAKQHLMKTSFKKMGEKPNQPSQQTNNSAQAECVSENICVGVLQ